MIRFLVLLLLVQVNCYALSTGTCIDTDTKFLTHADGADGSTTVTDSSSVPKTVTAVGNAQLDTAQKKFGTASVLFDGSGDYLTMADSTDWDIGTGAFTVDLQFRLPADGDAVYYTFSNNSGNFRGAVNTADNRIEVTTPSAAYNFSFTPSVDTWYHLAITRTGSSLRTFINGTQIGSTETDSSDIQSSGTFQIASDMGGSSSFNGWLDEIRIIKGTAVWTANFTAPTSAYSNSCATAGMFQVLE